MFHEFIRQIEPIKNADIPFFFRNQFKIKENFINPNSKYFDGLVLKLFSEEKQGIKKKWDKQCKMLFIWVLAKFFQLKNRKSINPTKEEWLELANILSTTEIVLKQRWITLINPQSKSIVWDPEEDAIIRSLMTEQEEKHIWTSIALELYNRNSGQFIRTPKQVRERWMNYLNPKLKKSNWNSDEDTQLLILVVKNGKRWSLISSLLEGRTENQVKNRFKSLMQKIYKEEDDDEIEEIFAIKEYLKKLEVKLEFDPKEIQHSQNREPQRQTKQRKRITNRNELNSVEKQNKIKKINSEVVEKINSINLKEEEQNPLINQIKVKDINNTENQQCNNIQIKEKVQQYYQPKFEVSNNITTPNPLQYVVTYNQDKQQIQNFNQMQVNQQLLYDQYIKNYQQNYNITSPYIQFNQTPLQYTPTQPIFILNNNSSYFSPQQQQYYCMQDNISPLQNSTLLQYTIQQFEQYYNQQQQQQQQQLNIQYNQIQKVNEQEKQLEFICDDNLNQWKKKREQLKQSNKNQLELIDQ